MKERKFGRYANKGKNEKSNGIKPNIWVNEENQHISKQDNQSKAKKNAGTDKEESSFITKISQKPGYIIATLISTLLGALGGVPGCFQLLSYFRDKPTFNYHRKQFI